MLITEGETDSIYQNLNRTKVYIYHNLSIVGVLFPSHQKEIRKEYESTLRPEKLRRKIGTTDRVTPCTYESSTNDLLVSKVKSLKSRQIWTKGKGLINYRR